MCAREVIFYPCTTRALGDANGLTYFATGTAPWQRPRAHPARPVMTHLHDQSNKETGYRPALPTPTPPRQRKTNKPSRTHDSHRTAVFHKATKQKNSNDKTILRNKECRPLSRPRTSSLTFVQCQGGELQGLCSTDRPQTQLCPAALLHSSHSPAQQSRREQNVPLTSAHQIDV